MDLFKKAVLNNNKIYSKIEGFLDRLYPMVDQYDTNVIELKKLKNEYEINEQIPLTKTIKTDSIDTDLINNYMQNYNISKTQELIIFNIYNRITVKPLQNNDGINQLSQTYFDQTSQLYTQLSVDFSAYKRKTALLDEQILHGVKHTLDTTNTSNLEEFTNQLKTLYTQYSNSTNLYAYILHSLMHEFFKQKKGELLLDLIENEKNNALGATKVMPQDPPISAWGLLATQKTQTLETILETINITPKTIRSPPPGVCILLFKKITPQPIIYNLETLFQVSSTATSVSTEGINKDIIAKFNILQKGKESKTLDFSLTIYGGKPGPNIPNYLVIDQLDSTTFRLLQPWPTAIRATYEQPGSDTQPRRSLIPWNKIKHIFSISRCDAYHTQMTENALQNSLFLSHKVDSLKLKETSKIYESKYIRNDLFNTLLDIFMNKLPIPTCNQDLIENTLNEKINNIFTNTLIAHYEQIIVKSQNLNQMTKHNPSELFSTFLSTIYYRTIEFSKELQNQVYKNLPKSDFYTDTNSTDNDNHAIRQIYEEIIKNTINSLFTDDNNVYQTVLHKYQLLQVT